MSQRHDIVVTAGHIGTSDPQGMVPQSYVEQVSRAVENLGRVLAKAGAGLAKRRQTYLLSSTTVGDAP